MCGRGQPKCDVLHIPEMAGGQVLHSCRCLATTDTGMTRFYLCIISPTPVSFSQRFAACVLDAVRMLKYDSVPGQIREKAQCPEAFHAWLQVKQVQSCSEAGSNSTQTTVFKPPDTSAQAMIQLPEVSAFRHPSPGAACLSQIIPTAWFGKYLLLSLFLLDDLAEKECWLQADTLVEQVPAYRYSHCFKPLSFHNTLPLRTRRLSPAVTRTFAHAS